MRAFSCSNFHKIHDINSVPFQHMELSRCIVPNMERHFKSRVKAESTVATIEFDYAESCNELNKLLIAYAYIQITPQHFGRAAHAIHGRGRNLYPEKLTGSYN